MKIDFIILYLITFIFGAVFGSFACCQAWRIHESKSGKKLGSRSVCMHCKKRLKWFDNIPIISWLALRGKCRYCKKKIGIAEIFAEIGLGLVFTAIVYKYSCTFPSVIGFFNTNFWSFLIHPLVLLIAFVPFWIILIYDAKWGELPVFLMLIEIVIALLYQFSNHGDWFQIAISSGLLSGLYYLLYFFSKEKLVGGGDWILCLSIGIFLGRWEFIILELFFSNFAATIAGIPQIFTKKKKPIPFGPFLILSMLLILLTEVFIKRFLVI